MRPTISAGAWFASGLGFLAFAVTFFLAATFGPIMIGLGFTFTALSAICVIAAYRTHYSPTRPPGTVSYKQFMDTRERLQLDLQKAQGEVERLTKELEKSKAREIDPIRKLAFSQVAKTQIGDARKKHIVIFAMPTAFDAPVLAGHILEMLQWGKVNAELRNHAPEIKRDTLQAFGIWIVGDPKSELVHLIKTTLRDEGLFTIFRSWKEVDSSSGEDNNRYVEIIVGDRADSLRNSRYDSASGGDLAG